MGILQPTSLKMVAHYRGAVTRYAEIANELSIPRFDSNFMDDLARLLGTRQNAQLFEAVARISDYGNIADHADMRKAVSKLLRKRGVNLPRGKRTNPALEKLVESLAPLLIYMGLPPASSERSKLVVVLRQVVETFNIPGDPRDTLRTQIKIDRAQSKRTREVLAAMFSRALRGLGAEPD